MIPWRTEWLPTPGFLPRESHGQRSLAVYCSWGCKESGMTEWLNWKTKCFHFILQTVVVTNGIAHLVGNSTTSPFWELGSTRSLSFPVPHWFSQGTCLVLQQLLKPSFTKMMSMKDMWYDVMLKPWASNSCGTWGVLSICCCSVAKLCLPLWNHERWEQWCDWIVYKN